MTLKEFMDMDYGGINEYEVSVFEGSEVTKYYGEEVYDEELQSKKVFGYGITLGERECAGLRSVVVICTVAVK